MQVADVMTRNVRIARPDQSIREAAELMSECDCGALPVGEGDRLVGMVTDRDIVTRAVAFGMGCDTRVGEVMSESVKYCFEDESLEQVGRNMADVQLRRLPVLDRDKRLVGILALGDLACAQGRDAAHALSGISEQPGDHVDGGSKPH